MARAGGAAGPHHTQNRSTELRILRPEVLRMPLRIRKRRFSLLQNAPAIPGFGSGASQGPGAGGVLQYSRSPQATHPPSDWGHAAQRCNERISPEDWSLWNLGSRPYALKRPILPSLVAFPRYAARLSRAAVETAYPRYQAIDAEPRVGPTAGAAPPHHATVDGES